MSLPHITRVVFITLLAGVRRQRACRRAVEVGSRAQRVGHRLLPGKLDCHSARRESQFSPSKSSLAPDRPSCSTISAAGSARGRRSGLALPTDSTKASTSSTSSWSETTVTLISNVRHGLRERLSPIDRVAHRAGQSRRCERLSQESRPIAGLTRVRDLFIRYP